MGFEVAVVSRRQISFSPGFKSSDEAIADWKPDYIVIASRTEEHANDIAHLERIGFNGDVLVEKPLFAHSSIVHEKSFRSLHVAYNLRFHPLMDVFRGALKNQKILALTVHVGQFLGDWRPDTNYRDSYSAGRDGGGVLRDLSHELDYVLWLTGTCKRVTALGGKLSQLEIESDDVASVLMETERCPAVSIHMNYLQKHPQRNIVAITHDQTIKADFIAGSVTVDSQTQSVKTEVNESYRRQHEAVSSAAFQDLCTVKQGQAVVELIAAIELSILEKRWIEMADGL